MKEQIEEMTFILSNCCDDVPIDVCENTPCNRCRAEHIYKAGYRKQSEGECPYCRDRTITELPLKTNCDTSRVGVLIAQGDKKKEIVFWSNVGTYGIEINFCPICGAKMKGGAE